MNKQPFLQPFRAAELARCANSIVKSWVQVNHHEWRSLYAWKRGNLYDSFGDVVGLLNANTVYLYDLAISPQEDLLHELGHAVARKFDMIGHQENGFNGSWEKRQVRLIAQIQHGRYWSPTLERIRKENQREGNSLTPALGSELWAEIFMSWYLYPDKTECALIEPEMRELAQYPELVSIDNLVEKISYLKQKPEQPADHKN